MVLQGSSNSSSAGSSVHSDAATAHAQSAHAQSGPAQSTTGFTLSRRGLFALLSLLRPHKVGLSLGILGLLVGAGLNLYLPVLLKRFIDLMGATASGARPELSGLVGLTLAVFAAQGIAFHLRTRQFGTISHRIAGQIRAAIYNGVLRRSATFLDTQRSGDLAARLSSEVQLVQDALGIRLIVLVRYGLQVVVGTVLMSLVSTKLTIALIVGLLALVGIGFLFSRSLRRASKELNSEVGALTALFTEALSGVKFLQAHSSVAWMIGKLDIVNRNAIERGRTRAGVSAAFQSFVSFLLNSALVLLGAYGLVLVMAQELSAGDFGAFVSYAAIVAVSFSFLIASISEVSQALGAWERLVELVPEQSVLADTPAPIVGSSRTAAIVAEIPKISFERVTFSYQPNTAPSLQDVSFVVQPGQRVALVGRSGAGKSTVLALLLGFYEPDSGEIKVEMAPSEGLALKHNVRDSVVYVPQEPQLFGLSIRDNLLVTAPHASDAELMEALRRARLEALFTSQTVTLDTRIGERGLTLSTGQRQRLALARAFLSSAKIVLLDEPTANLDAENEQAIKAALAELFVGRSSITVAHRFSTIMESDLVIVLDAGRVVELGSPSALISGSGVFHHLASLQRSGVDSEKAA